MKKDSIALACLEKAVSLNPENQTYPERLAQYYIGNQQYDKAIDSYELIYAHNHDNTDALRILLQLYQQKNDFPKMLSIGNWKAFLISTLLIWSIRRCWVTG